MTRATVDLAEFPAQPVHLNAAGRAHAAAIRGSPEALAEYRRTFPAGGRQCGRR